jgi:hypothetical protein
MTPAQPALDAMMEGVTRYFLSDPYDAATMQPELPPFSLGEWVAATDYNALAAEVRAQRETIAGLTARVEALTVALDNIRELNMTGRDENGHRWAHSDLIEQEIVAAKGGHPQ